MKIERVSLRNFEEGRTLLRHSLGSFFDNLEDDSICLVAKADEQVVGAAYAPQDIDRSREFLRHTFLTVAPEKALSTAGLVVLPSWRGRGIGGSLLLQREAEAQDAGYEYILCQSWLQSPSPSAGLLRSNGMQEAARLPGYWKKDYPIPEYCDRCGNLCLCTAILFYKKLDK